MKNITRLEALRFKNIKNIKEGCVYFNEQKKLERGIYDENELSSVLGIYGQNGSGKTTALDALRFIQILFSNAPIAPTFVDFINCDSGSMSVGADFLVNIKNRFFYVYYDIDIGKRNDNRMFIASEKLSYFELGKERDKCNFFEFRSGGKIKDTFLSKLASRDKVIYQYTSSIETDATTNNGFILSAIFNSKLLNIAAQNKDGLGDYFDIISALASFGRNNLAIYSINYFNENSNVGIRFRVREQNENMVGDIFVPFTPYALDTRYFKVFEQIISKVNRVMPSIIPGYVIKIQKTNNAEIQKLTNSVEFYMTSQRFNNKPIALIYESNGIKKIISVLSGLIDAYSNEGCLMAIDEIDSGIFEYLLGEIVYAFDNFGKGQLIFTSHNMRILEKVNYKNIFFTTVDHSKAFIQFTNVRESNNLRDMYYKYIANGYEKEPKLYDMVETEQLISALYVNEEV